MTQLDDQIKLFLSGAPHAVVGASRDRAKFGNKVLRAYIQHARPVFAVNPHETDIEGVQTLPRLRDLPEAVYGISIITPPRITEGIIAEALDLGIRHIWIQPGAESSGAINRARTANANIIAGGPCILVELGSFDSH